jgi:glutaredoxin-like protein NrdH
MLYDRNILTEFFNNEVIFMEYEKYIKHVDGDNAGDVFLFALSTCGWCKKTKMLLNELGVEYKYVDVDLLTGVARREVVEEMEKWDSSGSFPLVVIDNAETVTGFKEAQIRRLLGFE